MEYRQNTLDYETYYHLRESVGWNNFCKEQAVKAIENGVYNVTVYHGDRAVAMGRLVGDGMYYTIVDIVVDPEFQGKKIGTRIIEMILEHVEEHLPLGGRASVQLIAAQGKEEFYEKQGFKRIPHENCGSGMRKVMYK